MTNKDIEAAFLSGTTVFGITDSAVTANEKIIFFSSDSASIPNLFPNLSLKKYADTLRFESAVDVVVGPNWVRSIFPMLKYRNALDHP